MIPVNLWTAISRRFYREFGCNPGEYAKAPVPLTVFIPNGVKFRELRKDEIDTENVQSVFIQVLHKSECKVNAEKLKSNCQA